MGKIIRVGMIGAGQIAYRHCKEINGHPEARVTCAADLSDERGKAIKKEFEMDRVYTKWEDLVADPEVDAVSIALPNILHAPVSIGAIKAGKHVLLDKPFALNLAEAKRVAALTKKSRKVFMVGMNRRFQEDAQKLKVIAARGDLGDIYHAKGYWVRRSGSPKFGTWFCRKDIAGGGALLDIGIHMLDTSLYRMGNWKPVAVSGATYTKFGNRGLGEGGWGMSDKSRHVFDVDDFATALIKFQNGATLQLDAAWACHQETNGSHGVQLFGTEAGGAMPNLKLFRYGKKKGEYEVVEPQNVKIPYPHESRFIHWIDVILKKEKALCTVDQALIVQTIIDGIYRSSQTGKEIRLR